MEPRRYDQRGGVYCAIPIGESTLEGNAIIKGMAALMSRMRVLSLPTNTKFMMQVCLNNNRAKAREAMVEKALARNAEWILWIDADVLPPCDALTKLFARNTDIVGGLVVTKSDTPQPIIIRKGQSYQYQDWQPGDLVPCDALGFGCTLMRTEIFEKLERPWFYEGTGAFTEGDSWSTTEDAPLMYRAKDAGFDCYVDTSVICQHVDWKSGLRFSWDSEKQHPVLIRPDGTKLVFYNAEQQMAYQEARDCKEGK